jgi:hypothetical protein
MNEKPCPFCGRERDCLFLLRPRPGQVQIACICGATGPTATNERAAWTAWARRDGRAQGC